MIDQDSVWLITGCSRGLGRAIAAIALERGFRAVVTARDLASVHDLVEGNPRAWARSLDVTRREEVAAGVHGALERFGRIDVLVNNAGYGLLGAVEDTGEAEARRLFDTNYFGAVQAIRAVLPAMRRQRRGHIVNISSVGGFCALPACGHYAASKFALEGMSEALAQEVAPLGIRVTVVEPNGMRTDFLSPRSLQHAAATPTLDYDASAGEQIRRFSQADGHQPTDPLLAAEAVLLAVDSSDPPFRLVLGSSGVQRVREKLRQVQTEVARWEDVSCGVALAGAA